MGRGAGPGVFIHAGRRPAAAGGRAPRFCRRRVFRRRAGHAGRGARAVRLCDAGVVEDRRQCGVLQRHLSALRHHAAETWRDDAWRARRRAVFPLPRAVDRDRRASARRPHSARGEHRRRIVRGGSVRHRRRVVYGRTRSRDQFQTVRSGRARRHECEGGQPRLRTAAAAESGFCCSAGDVLPAARNFARADPWRRRLHHRRAFYAMDGPWCRLRPSLRSSQAR